MQTRSRYVFLGKWGLSTGGPGARLGKCPREQPAIHTWRGHGAPFPTVPPGDSPRWAVAAVQDLTLTPSTCPSARSPQPAAQGPPEPPGQRARHGQVQGRASQPTRPDPTRALTAPPHAVPGAAPSRRLGSGGSRTGPSGPAQDPHAGQLFLPPSLPTDVRSERGFCLSSQSPHLARRVCFPNSPDGAVGSGRFVLLFPSLRLRSHTSRGP